MKKLSDKENKENNPLDEAQIQTKEFLDKIKGLEKELTKLNKDLTKNPNNRENQFKKLNCLYNLRRFREGSGYAHDISEKLDASDKNKELHEVILNIFYKAEDWYNLLSNINKFNLIDLFEKSDYILDIAAACYCEEKHEEKLEQMIQEYPNKNFLKFYTAKTNFYNKDYPGALYVLDSIINNVSKDKQGKMLSLKGKIFLKLNKPLIDACKLFEHARLIEPTNLSNYKHLVKLNLLLGYSSRKFTKQALDISEEGVNNMGKGELVNNIILYLYHIKALCRNYKRHEATNKLNEVRELLMEKTTKYWLSKRQMIKVYRKYFEVFHMCRFLDVDFDSSVFSIDLNKKIGSGGFGIVYAGKLRGKEVSVKVFNLDKNITAEDDVDQEGNLCKLFESIFKEVSIMDILSEKCDFILKVNAMFFRNNYKELTLITDLCKGGDYSKILRNPQIEISNKTRVKILLQLAKAIQHIHSFKKPFSHNDIKSLNVLFFDEFNNNGENKICLCDFGLADYEGEPVRGFTPNYTAPEIIRGEDFDCSCDLYSFGVVIWESFSRKTPYAGKDREEIIEMVTSGETLDIGAMEPGTPKELVELTKRLFKDKFERPKMKEILKVLEKLASKLKN